MNPTDPREHDPAITHPDPFIHMQTSATRSRVFRKPTAYELEWRRQPYSIEEEPDPDIRRVIEQEGARPSSLIPVHKARIPDPLHDLQLLKDLKIINERTARELSPLPPGGLPVQKKYKPRPCNADAPVSTNFRNENDGDKTMRFNHVGAAASALMTVGIAACNPSMQATAAAVEAASVPAASQHDAQIKEVPIPTIASEPGGEPFDASWNTYKQPTDAIEAEVPPGFDSFGRPPAPIGDNRYCVVGGVFDGETELSYRPYVYIADKTGKRVGWVKPLNVPHQFFDSVATNCLRKGNALYVLQSSNTLMQASLSQAVPRLVKLDLTNGRILASVDFGVPGVDGLYSAWGNGAQGLSSSDFGVVISGKYSFQDDDKRDTRIPFRIEFNDDLTQFASP